MSAGALLDHLAGLGIRLSRDGEALAADVLPGADLAPHLDLIRERKPALVAELALREAIIAAATVEPEHFDRAAFDRLWARWAQENAA